MRLKFWPTTVGVGPSNFNVQNWTWAGSQHAQAFIESTFEFLNMTFHEILC